MKTCPLISWQNLLCDEDIIITHSPDEAGYPFENISDWRDYTFWKSSSAGDLYIKLDAGAGKTVTVDTLAIAGHNMASAGAEDISISCSDDDSSYTDCVPPFTPSDDLVVFKSFDPCNHRFFKFLIPAGYSDAPRIGVLFIGQSMEIPGHPEQGFDPDILESEEAAEYGRTGNLLGVSRKFSKRKIKADFNNLAPEFIKNEFIPFWKTHSGKPFFFTWDPDNKPDESYLVKFSSASFSSPYDKSSRSLSFEMTAALKD